MIKNLNNVFGRKPAFKNVEVNGNCVVTSDIAITDNATTVGTATVMTFTLTIAST